MLQELMRRHALQGDLRHYAQEAQADTCEPEQLWVLLLRKLQGALAGSDELERDNLFVHRRYPRPCAVSADLRSAVQC